MKPFNKVRKIKERLLFFIDDIKELDNFCFSKYVPAGAKKVEITFKETKELKQILEIDYIVSLQSTKIEE